MGDCDVMLYIAALPPHGPLDEAVWRVFKGDPRIRGTRLKMENVVLRYMMGIFENS